MKLPDIKSLLDSKKESAIKEFVSGTPVDENSQPITTPDNEIEDDKQT